MQVRRLAIFMLSGIILLCVALIPVSLGFGAVALSTKSPVPNWLWWSLGIAIGSLFVVIFIGRSKGH